MRLFFLLVTIAFTATAQTEKPVVYYVGNMGVAIVKNDSVILIDALHDYYDVYYSPTDPEVLKKLNIREKPFRKLVAITATHMHNDHFDETLITQLSQNLSPVKVVMGKQPAEQLPKVAKGSLQVVDQKGTVKLSDQLSISFLNVGHTGGNRNGYIENYRIEIKWGQYRFVHFGDAAPSAKTFEGLQPGADVAIIPYWFCLDENDIRLLESQKFKSVIATHIDPRGVSKFAKTNFEVVPFKTYGQQFTVK